ncbi:MAG: ribonuclease HI [Spirochaetota bacterium]|jgi:ribonuclease HI|nr:ribonuclease HI [Spirochaetota bacterium]
MKIKVQTIQAISCGRQYLLEFSSGSVLLNYYYESKKRTLYMQKASSPELQAFVAQYTDAIRDSLDQEIGPRGAKSFVINIRTSKSTPAEQKGYVLFSDGGSNPNPGKGAAAWFIRDPSGNTKEGAKYAANTTNNRMELMAVLEGLSRIPTGSDVAIYLDSQYVQKGMMEWIEYWKINSWRTKRNKEVVNRDLWEKLDKLALSYHITWYWVPGHSGHTENERCDALVQESMHKGRSI